MTYKNHLQQNGTQEGQSITTKDKTSQLEFIKKVQRYRYPILDIIARALSKFADEEFLLFIFPTFAWAIHARLCVHLALLVPLGYGVGNILKNLFCVERPKSSDIWLGRIVNEDDYGFPSTHSLQAVIFPFYLIYYVSRGLDTFTQLVLWSFCVFFWFAVAWSRLYLGVHFLEDVIFGGVVGLILSFGYVILIEPFESLFTSGSFFASLLASLPFLAQVVFHPLYYHWDKRKNKRFDKWAIHMSNSGYLVSARLLGVAWAVPFGIYLNPEFYTQTRLFYLYPTPALFRFIVGLPLLVTIYFTSRVLLTKAILWLYRVMDIPAVDLQGNAGHSGETVVKQQVECHDEKNSPHPTSYQINETKHDECSSKSEPNGVVNHFENDQKMKQKTWFNFFGYTSLQVKPPRIFLQYAIMALVIIVAAPKLFQKLGI